MASLLNRLPYRSPDQGSGGGPKEPNKPDSIDSILKESQRTLKDANQGLPNLRENAQGLSEDLKQISKQEESAQKALEQEQKQQEEIREYLKEVQAQMQQGITGELFPDVITELNKYIQATRVPTPGIDDGSKVIRSNELIVSADRRNKLDQFVLTRIVRELAGDPNLESVLDDIANSLAKTVADIIREQDLPVTTKQNESTPKGQTQAVPTIPAEEQAAMQAVIDAFAKRGVKLQIDTENGRLKIDESKGTFSFFWKILSRVSKAPIKNIKENLKQLHGAFKDLETSQEEQKNIEKNIEGLKQEKDKKIKQLEAIQKSVEDHLKAILNMATLLKDEGNKYVKEPLLELYSKLGLKRKSNFIVLESKQRFEVEQEIQQKMQERIGNITAKHGIDMPNEPITPTAIKAIEAALEEKKRIKESDKNAIEEQLSDQALEDKKRKLEEDNHVQELEKKLQNLSDRITTLEEAGIDPITLADIKAAFQKLPDLTPKQRAEVAKILTNIIGQMGETSPNTDKANEQLMEYIEDLMTSLRNPKKLQKLTKDPLFEQVAKLLINSTISENNLPEENTNPSPTDNSVNFILSLSQYKQLLQQQKETVEAELNTARNKVNDQFTEYKKQLQKQLSKTTEEISEIEKSLQQVRQDREIWEEIQSIHGLVEHRIQPINSQLKELYKKYKELSDDLTEITEDNKHATPVQKQKDNNPNAS